MVLLPMEEGDGDTEEVKRFKRSLDPSEITQINEISRRVLRSIEAVLIAEKDHGKCLHQVLCENNKYSKERKDGQKIWIPIWGLGLSWLSSRIITNQLPSGSILESIKASTMGLGGANCTKIFPNCDLKMIEEDRKQRRIKRELHNFPFEWSI